MVGIQASIAGQDGSYLTELLLAKGYEVYGLIRRARTFNTANTANTASTARIDHLYSDPHHSELLNGTPQSHQDAVRCFLRQNVRQIPSWPPLGLEELWKSWDCLKKHL